MRNICDREECYGCHACYNICPKQAIDMGEDAYGNLIPVINTEKCIDCKLCAKVCPSINQTLFSLPMHTYAAVANNLSDYKTSTSGGIATVFSRQILEQGGVVYGAAVTKGLNVQHVRVDSEEKLRLLQGSKYVQSAIDNSFKEIKKDLKDGKKVLFIGTSCQVDGLLKFLNYGYENLITVNLICHGTPANRLLKEHCKKLVPDCDINHMDVKFRGLRGCFLQIMDKNDVKYQKEFFKDSYFAGFMRKLFYRNACYSCKYAQKERVGDITIGDFWGFDQSEPFVSDTSYGLSAVLVNTNSGVEFFESCKEHLLYQERTLEEAVAGNPQLRAPSQKHRNFDKFRKLYLKYGFEKAARKSLWIDMLGYRLLFFIRK